VLQQAVGSGPSWSSAIDKVRSSIGGSQQDAYQQPVNAFAASAGEQWDEDQEYFHEVPSIIYGTQNDVTELLRVARLANEGTRVGWSLCASNECVSA
jgi:hypothetical protein